ncbi:hypothetical protein B2G71_04460 [Novosphingobium sp. PC22D]|uniref:TetR/AcrR family transcriptional regulator n=1 Tax=Novosphingobium sp. PC22D TaxID=1962403 RepID=UPI000BFAD980|nr:TetR/AcrR family transcriptional regulator [Novosphingobium sp. PC22D]PEQ13589.1 hypothetical protein B2G71_04460 [Novosphingobium sp. PC22D]
MDSAATDAKPPREAILDAAEQVMRENGYAAVTSRRVAAVAGLKAQLVHYYFQSMDELFLEVFRRLAREILARQDEAEHADKPLRAMWDLLSDSRYRILIYEFVALGNHRKQVGTEFFQFGDELREKQVKLMRTALKRRGQTDFPWSPEFAAILLHALSRFLSLEAELGVSAGHANAIAVVNYYLDLYDRPESSLERRCRELEAENADLRAQLKKG